MQLVGCRNSRELLGALIRGSTGSGCDSAVASRAGHGFGVTAELPPLSREASLCTTLVVLALVIAKMDGRKIWWILDPTTAAVTPDPDLSGGALSREMKTYSGRQVISEIVRLFR